MVSGSVQLLSVGSWLSALPRGRTPGLLRYWRTPASTVFGMIDKDSCRDYP
jgi:hypothetical protein